MFSTNRPDIKKLNLFYLPAPNTAVIVSYFETLDSDNLSAHVEVC